MTVAIMGASGYAGRILMRLLLEHPEIKNIFPVSASSAGESLDSCDPGLIPDSKFPNGPRFLDIEKAIASQPDAVFSALPAGISANFCSPFLGKSVLFDLSADFRLQNVSDHERFYKQPLPFPQWRKKAIYGLAEIHRNSIQHADIIALPGCYPTCVLLPLLPIAQSSLIHGHIIVNAISGISGAGKTPSQKTMFVERAESVTAYNPGVSHRHIPEMKQELALAGCKENITFTPHLAPLRRGMVATTVIPSSSIHTESQVEHTLKEAYSNEPFIRLLPNGIPNSQDVTGSNRCDIGWKIDNHDSGSFLHLFSAIDNLIKGAAGQAVQCFNIRFGFPETLGLPRRGST